MAHEYALVSGQPFVSIGEVLEFNGVYSSEMYAGCGSDWCWAMIN